MEVILLKDIEKLGKEGQVIKVKDGYARNCLIPQKMALRASAQNYKRLEEIKRHKIKAAEQEKKKFAALKEKLGLLSLTVAVEAKEDDSIYGSISEPQILSLLDEEGIKLDKGKIILDDPIKKLGVYNLSVTLCPETTANLRIWVVKK